VFGGIEVDAVGRAGDDNPASLQHVGDAVRGRHPWEVFSELTGLLNCAIVHQVEGRERVQRRRDDEQDLPRKALLDRGEHGGALGDIGGVEVEAGLKVVCAEHNRHEVQWSVRFEARLEVALAVSAGFERVVPDGGATVKSLLDHVVISAQLPLEDTRPPFGTIEADAGGGVGRDRFLAEGVGIAVAENRFHWSLIPYVSHRTDYTLQG